jgi:hypothetical protein
MDKQELIQKLEQSREEFLDTIEGLSEDEMEQPGAMEGWSVKDILAHIALWESELVKLLFQARQGRKPATVHFSGESVDERNAKWHHQSKERPLERVLDDFHCVRNQTVRRVEAFPDRDLDDPQRFPWLQGEPLWKWIAEDSFEHEAEHTADIRKWREQRLPGSS